MKVYDLRHPDTGETYRLSFRVLHIPDFLEIRRWAMVPLIKAGSIWIPCITREMPIIRALPDGYEHLSAEQVQVELVDRNWLPWQD